MSLSTDYRTAPGGLLGGLGARIGDLYQALGHTLIVSVGLLMTRIGVGLVFWKSAHTKVDSDYNITETTIFLFQEEYQVPLLPPELAAQMATAMELALPLLLWAGLATRLGALGLLGMTVVIQLFVYPNLWTDHIFWAGALVVLIAKGPGIFSLDRLVGPVLIGKA